MRSLILLSMLIAADALAQTCATKTLACSTTTAAALASTDCTASDGSRYQLWTFNGTAGDEVTIEMHSTAFDTYLLLLDPDGLPLTDSDDLAHTATDSKMVFTLTANGTWTVVANSLAASKTGDYTISLVCPNAVIVPPARRRATR
ncbi:MAG: pre-peptidase C-terminal domain-containing protein [Acidobacteria bacterium]|nr:pre-peptidase C-terminal domain-containing protein [Acidobacteriota bacterium]